MAVAAARLVRVAVWRNEKIYVSTKYCQKMFLTKFIAFFDNYPSGLELASKYKNMFLAEKRVRKIGYFLHIVINIICRLTKLKKVVCMNILLGRE